MVLLRPARWECAREYAGIFAVLHLHSESHLSEGMITALPASSQGVHESPRVSITPVFHWHALTLRSRPGAPTLLDAPEAVLTTSGRAAFALALRLLDVGPGDEVLVPAYRCLALVAPIAARGAEAVSYRMQPDLSFSIEELRERVTPRTRGIVLIHFFGFPQPGTAELRDFCDRTGIVLIEDCAHMFYGAAESGPPGSLGDVAIGSLMKFLPVYDGGCLVSHRRSLNALPALRGNGLMYEVKAIQHLLEKAAQWSGSAGLGVLSRTISRAGRWAKRASPNVARTAAAASPAATHGSVEFEERWVETRPARLTSLLARHANHARSIAARRSNFECYARGLTSTGGGSPFREHLPPGVVPYVFPFLLADPEAAFPALRAAGVPMFRWEDVDGACCDVSRDLRERLVQFPCHQDIQESQLLVLIEVIRNVLAVCHERNRQVAHGAGPSP